MVRKGIFLFVLLLTSCQTNQSGIGYSVDFCCVEKIYRTFTVRSENFPEFLRPLMVSSFQAVFSEKGFNPVERNGDLEVLLRYEQEDIDEVSRLDDFEGHLEPGGKLRYMAKVRIEIRELSGGLVWSGNMQRIHDVDAGEYMHAGKATVALQNTMRLMLKSFSDQ